MRIAQRFNVMKQILMVMAFLLVAIMMTSLWVGERGAAPHAAQSNLNCQKDVSLTHDILVIRFDLEQRSACGTGVSVRFAGKHPGARCLVIVCHFGPSVRTWDG
jgi:hypothetical protein